MDPSGGLHELNEPLAEMEKKHGRLTKLTRHEAEVMHQTPQATRVGTLDRLRRRGKPAKRPRSVLPKSLR